MELGEYLISVRLGPGAARSTSKLIQVVSAAQTAAEIIDTCAIANRLSPLAGADARGPRRDGAGAAKIVHGSGRPSRGAC
jgi:hypothetical protein